MILGAIVAWFTALFKGLWTLLMVASVGAAAGIGSWVAGRLLGPLAAAGVASAIVLGAYYGGLVSVDAAAKIERLEREKAVLEKARQAERAVAEFERKQAAEQIADAKERAKRLADALSKIEDGEGLSPEELEAIKELQR